MAEVITSSTPHISFKGTRDVSGNRAQGAPEVLPFHRPLHFFYSAKGPLTATFYDTAKFAEVYGSEVLDVNSEFATHVTPFLNEAMAAVARFMSIRVIPADMPNKSNLGVSIDYIEGPVPLYERNEDGSYKLAVDGTKIPTGDTVPGIIAKYVVAEVGVDDDGVTLLGKRKVEEGSMVEGAVKSKLMPFFDLEALDYGDGTKIGFRLYAPTTASQLTADPDYNEQVGAYCYRFSLLTRADELSSPAIEQSVWGEASTLISFGENILDKTGSGKLLDFAEIVPGRWTDDSLDTLQRPLVSEPHVYQENIATLLTRIQTLEASYQTVEPGVENIHKINFISGVTVENVPYYTYMVQGVLDGSASFTTNSTHYLKGGGTGTMSNATFNEAVRKILADFDGTYRLSNIARYPFNAFWDSGFSMDVKLLIPKIQSERQDSWIAIATQDISEPDNDPEKDEAIATGLITRLQQYPDSVDFNTPPFRGLIAGHSAQWMGSNRKVRTPLLLDLYRKYCNWGGDSSGRAMEDNAPDNGQSPNGDNRVVTRVKKITNLDMIFRVRRRLWQAGIVYVEDYDTSSQFYSGIQSFYPDQTSVLKSAAVGLCVANINRYAWEVWRAFTGNQNLRDDQLIERSEKLITARTTENISSGRMVAQHHCELTRLDAENGYSWTLRSDIGVSGMRTVLNASIVAYRREELEDNG